jgi:hypothetical protein
MQLFSLLMAALVFITGCCSEQMVGERKLSNNSSVKEYMTLPIIPHAGESYRLEVNGKSYHNVCGSLYLAIPEKNLICFRTEPNIGACYLHVVPTKPDFKEFKIKLDKFSSFGHSLGLDKTNSFSTYVYKIEGDDIYFIERFYKRGQNRYRLDLDHHTLEIIEKGEIMGPARD